MKLFKITKYLLIAVVLVSLAACNDILENVEPATSVSGEVVLSTEGGVNALRASIYSQLRASFNYTTEYFIGPSAFADETRARPGATRFQGLNTAIGTSGTAHLTSFGSTYGIVNDANLIINAIQEGVLPQATLDQYRGEALAIRAYAMHHLVRAYGYEPGMIPSGAIDPNWDLGIIIRNTPTIDVADADERARSTVSQVYDQILSDLGEAKTLLSGITTPNTRVTEPFVDGLTARVNLYAGNWGPAAAAAQDAITNSGLGLVSTADGVAGMFFEDQGGHPEAIFKLDVNPDTEPIGGSNVNSGLAAYTSSQWVSQIPTNLVIDLYEEDDFRLGSFVTDVDGNVITDAVSGLREYEGGWYQPCQNDQQSPIAPVGGCDQVNDEGLSTNKWNGGNGNLSDDIPIMRVAEMYLIRAEALAKDAGSVTQPAQDALQELKDARNAGTIPAGALTSLESFETEVLNERVRELVVEGHRFWDLKRTGRDIRNPDGSIKMFYDSYRILGSFGAGLLNVNPRLCENPGYAEFPVENCGPQ